MTVTRTYSIASDFGGVLPISHRLQAEITAAIATTIVRIDIIGDQVDLVFVDALLGGEVTTLEGTIIPAHTGESAPDPVTSFDASGGTDGTSTTLAFSQTVNRTVTFP